MEETVIVIMIKEQQTGFLGKELISCAVARHDELLLNAFAEEVSGGLRIVLRLTCAQDVADEDFDAVFDYYDETVYGGQDVLCKEYEDCYNPTWELSFDYDEQTVAERINSLLSIHAAELAEVFDTIGNSNQGN